MEVDPEDSLTAKTSTLLLVNKNDNIGGEPATLPVSNNNATEPVPIEQEETAGTAPAGNMREEPGDQESGSIKTGTNEVCPHVIHCLPSCSSTGLG